MEFDHSQSHAGQGELACKDLVARLVDAIGRKLTAYVGGVRNVREVDRWLAGDAIDAEQESRFGLALRVVDILLENEPPEIVQSWLIGLNPGLGDRVPLRLLREQPVDSITADLLAAARAMSLYG